MRKEEFSRPGTCKAYASNKQEIATEDEMKLHSSSNLKSRGKKSHEGMKLQLGSKLTHELEAIPPLPYITQSAYLSIK